MVAAATGGVVGVVVALLTSPAVGIIAGGVIGPIVGLLVPARAASHETRLDRGSDEVGRSDDRGS